MENEIKPYLSEEEMRSACMVAGFEILSVWKLENEYWPKAYTDLFINNPWFLIKTKFGLIKIGARKRVFSINWSDTILREEITKDEVTQSDMLVHAWTLLKLAEYLKSLREKLEKAEDELAKKTEKVIIDMHHGT